MKLLYLGNQLSKHGYNKTTIETLGFHLEQEGFEIFYASNKKLFLLRLLHMIWAVLINRKQVSYILIDTYSTKAFWYAFTCSQLARLLKIKYIPILHGGNLPSRLKRNPRLCRMIFTHAHKNVAPSGYLKHTFEKEGFTNVVHIPNTIEIEKYEFKKRTNFSPNLLWVRAFASIYNPEMAIKVLFELRKVYPKATLTMVGPDKDGSLQTTKTFAKSINCEVNFTGQLAKEDWWQLAAKHDIFINTTHFDNTPISVMEAMALGLPVVTTNVGGIPYLLSDKENALLVNDNAVDEMTNAIFSLISDKEQASNIAQNARAYVEQMDWVTVKQIWKELLV